VNVRFRGEADTQPRLLFTLGKIGTGDTASETVGGRWSH